MAAWKAAPTYQAKILSSSGTTIKSSATLTAKPNLDGNAAGDISAAERNTLDFDIATKGNYIIQFREVGSGMQEFLLAECRLRDLSTLTGITTVNADIRRPAGIYDPSGRRLNALRRGLNIIVNADGSTRKVIVK
jgi:hypothetical protein